MAEEERDPERFLRVSEIALKMKAAINGNTIDDSQMAFANAIAQMVTASPDPQIVFLSTMAAIVEVYTMHVEHLRRGDPPNTIEGIPN